MYEMKWPNVFAFGLAIFACITLIRMHEQVGAFLGSMEHLGSSPSLTDRTHGLMAFGLVMVIVLGLFRLMFNSQDRN